MKKLITTVALLAITGASSAGSISFKESIVDSASGQQSHRHSLSYKEEISKGIYGDILFSNTVKDSTKSITNRTELGLSTSVYKQGQFGLGIRVATGAKLASGSNATYYYSVEPSVSLKLTDGLTAKVGYRFRDAYSDNVADRSNTNRIGLTYQLSKNNSINLSYDKQRGDGASTVTGLGFIHSF